MKKIICILLLCIGFAGISSAQEVYNSSGKTHYKKKQKKGYDPDRLVIGGGLNASFGGGYISTGISPILGYRLTKNLSAGIGVGYQYYRNPMYVDPVDPYKVSYAHSNIVYPSLWARYFVYRNIFVDGTLEYDLISIRKPGYNNMGVLGTRQYNVNNTCALIGVGLRQPLGGRVSFYGELFYDVLQGEYSPYPARSPGLRFGIAAGF